MSKIILGVQGVILIWPSLLGFMLIFGLMAPVMTQSFEAHHLVEFVYGIILLAFLVSAWRVYIWVMFNGPKTKKNISIVWLIICICALIYSIASFLIFRLTENIEIYSYAYRYSELFILGLYFIPTAIHIGIEWVWQSRKA